MLAKQHRLNRKEFNLVHKTGRKDLKESLLIYYLPAQNFKTSIVISKKLSKKAVLRNKLRRKLYNYFQSKKLKLQGFFIIYPQTYEIDLTAFDQVLSKLP